MSSLLKYRGLDINPSILSESTTIKVPTKDVKQLTESAERSLIIPRIEAIHVGRTKNFVHYTADKLRGDAALKSGVYSWTEPYAKPVIYNHDMTTDATGRVLKAAYAEYTQAGRPGIIVVPKITDPKAVQAIQDGRLLTVSVGAHTDAAICSICGTDIANEGFCGHMKGEEYDGQTAEWIAGNIWFDELSWVNLPADQDAMVVDSESALLTPTEACNHAHTMDAHEYYKVPRGVAITEAVSAEPNLAEEGGKGMDPKDELEKNTSALIEEEKPEAVEPEAVEPETDVKPEGEDAPEAVAPETKEAEETDEPAAVEPEDEKPVAEPAEDVEPEAADAPDAPAEAEVDKPEAEVVKESAETEKELTELREENTALNAQVKTLSEELKTFYKQIILEKADYDEERKAKFEERLNTRSLTGLKETYDDIEAGFFVPTKQKETKRKAEKVASPLKEAKETPKPETKQVDIQASMVDLLRK